MDRGALDGGCNSDKRAEGGCGIAWTNERGDGWCGCPRWRLNGELEVKGALNANCGAAGDDHNAVEESCDAVGGCNTVDSRNIVVEDCNPVDEGCNLTDKGCDSVDVLAGAVLSSPIASSGIVVS